MLSEMNQEDVIPESDFATLCPDGTFVQLEYIEDSKAIEPYDVEPGIWFVQATPSGLELKPTSFVKDAILDDFIHTKHISDKIDKFFNRLHIYAKHGIEVPKRGMLFYGPAGSGKSTIITKAIDKYSKDNKTAVIIWHTDKFEAYKIKDFVKSFAYKGVEKLILIAEDIGGVEMDQVRAKSDSSLLSLLDNQEKTFSIATLIIATTNHPEIFLGNLTNRPGRFDDKFDIGYPSAEHRVQLLKFFAKEEVSEEAIELMSDQKTSEFTPAHIRDVIVKADLYDVSLADSIRETVKEIQTYKKAFSKQKGLGIMNYDD